MISHKKKFIFVHINKTGGTSIEKALSQYAKPIGKKKHQFLLKECKKKPSKRPILNNKKDPHYSYFKFAIVRNPWEKMVSTYFWRKPLSKWQNISFKKWVMCSKKPSMLTNLAFYNQLDWISDRSGNVCVDYIGRFERLQESFDVICKKINIPPQKLPHKNKLKYDHYSSYYDKEIVEFVATHFKKDIDYFGYVYEG